MHLGEGQVGVGAGSWPLMREQGGKLRHHHIYLLKEDGECDEIASQGPEWDREMVNPAALTRPEVQIFMPFPPSSA